MQQQEESSRGDAIPAVDSTRREECNATLHDRCTALRVEESCIEEAKMVAAVRRLTVQQRQQRGRSGAVYAAAGRIGYQNILGSSDCVCAVSCTDLAKTGVIRVPIANRQHESPERG